MTDSQRTPSTTQVRHVELIEPMARAAGGLLRERFGNPGPITGKGQLHDTDRIYDVVTELDFACEQLIVESIRALSPNAVVLAEEGGVSLANPDQPIATLADAEDLWLVDPLDGTVNFAHSIPFFCVSIARYQCGVPVAGVIYDPMLDELFAFEGDEATRNGEPISVRQGKSPNESILGVGSLGTRAQVVAREFRSWRRMGSAALSLAYVACGRYDAYVQLGNLAPWDYGTGAPLVLAAGGTLTDHLLEQWIHPLEGMTGVVAAPQGIHARITELLS